MRLRTEGVSTRTVGDETIVLDLETSRYLTVSGVGVRLLELLSDGRDVPVDELVTTVTDEYEVDGATARRDIEGFGERLASVGLLAT